MSEFNLEAALSTIRDYLSRQPEVGLAYLYGSYAAGQPWAESDLDIGVLFLDEGTPYDIFQQALRHAAELQSKIGEIEIDLRELNGAPVEFLMQVIQTGHCLYARSERERVQFETRVIIGYLDFKPVLDEYYRELRQRLKEGRFSARLPRYIEETRAAVERARETGSEPASI
jgi:predicted nucleotidyltransferase